MSGPFGSNQFFGVAADSTYVPKGAMWFDSGDGTELNASSRSSDSSNKKRNIISVWRKGSYPQTASGSQLIGVASPDYDRIEFAGGGAQLQYTWDGGGTNYVVTSPALLRDPTAWQHLLISFDSTQASGSRVSFYYNGVLLPTQTYSGGGEVPADFESELLGNSITTDISDAGLNNSYFSEFIAIDGKSIQNGDVAISAFGTENSDGVWVPVDPTTVFASGSDFGNNGFYLDFADSSDFGNDVSGSNNDFTSSNTTTANWTYDRPADSGSDTGNYATGNPLDTEAGNLVWSAGNLTLTQNTTASDQARATIAFPITGKWRFKVVTPDVNGSTTEFKVGLVRSDVALVDAMFGTGAGDENVFAAGSAGNIRKNGVDNTAATVKNTTLEFLYDADSLQCIVKDISGSPSTLATITSMTSATYTMGVELYGSISMTFDFGQNGYTTSDSSYNPLNTANLPAPSITKPSDNFLPILYEGNGGSQRVGNFIPFTDAYTVDNSCVFDSGDSDYLSKTFSGAGNNKIGSISFWVKRGKLGTAQQIFHARSGSGSSQILFNSSNQLYYRLEDTSGNQVGQRTTNRLFKDPSNWVHILLTFDCANTTQQVYVNGVEETSFATSAGPTDTDTTISDATAHYIGSTHAPADYFDGYFSEYVYIDGTKYTPSSFGQTDTSTNRWIPKDPSGLTFGTNGFYLEFGTAADLGDDTSGNTNDWTENNIVAANQTVDTPTQNFTTLNPLDTTVYSSGLGTLSNGNRTHYFASGADTKGAATTISTSSGKWYWEVTYTTVVSSYPIVGILKTGTSATTSSVNEGVINNASNGNFYNFGTSITTGWSAISTGTVMMFALDQDNGALYVGRNGTWETVSSVVGVPDSGASKTGAISTNGALSDGTSLYPIVLDSGGSKTTCNFGATTFSYPIGASNDTEGFAAIQQDNLAENTAGITGLSWIKNRDAADEHIFQDRVRGIYVYMNNQASTIADTTNTNSVQRFLQQGVQIGNMDDVNTSAESFVLWQWANDGAETSNSDGTISGGSTVRVNTTAGFSIGTYNGSGSASTVGHGLGVIPHFIIVWPKSNPGDRRVYHQTTGNTVGMKFNTDSYTGSAGVTNSQWWNDSGPTADTFSIGTGTDVNQSGQSHLFYAWTEIEGYSKFGSYVGNGSTTGAGPFIYFGFKPSWIMVKRTDSTNNWGILDDKRNPYNPVELVLFADDTQTESGSGNEYTIFTANGFKISNDSTANWINASSGTYIYAAFAENPFGGSGVAQARAR